MRFLLIIKQSFECSLAIHLVLQLLHHSGTSGDGIFCTYIYGLSINPVHFNKILYFYACACMLPWHYISFAVLLLLYTSIIRVYCCVLYFSTVKPHYSAKTWVDFMVRYHTNNIICILLVTIVIKWIFDWNKN